MAINVDKIVTDITLELDKEDVSINDFIKAVDNFVVLVKEVAHSVVPTKDASAWTVTVYPGSVGIGLKAGETFTTFEVTAVSNAVRGGMQSLEMGNRSAYFSDKAIEYARNISMLFKKKAGNPTVRIGVETTLRKISRDKLLYPQPASLMRPTAKLALLMAR